MDIKFKWSEDMSVNHDVIDAQHKELFEKLNILLEAIVEDNGENIVEDMISFFEKYMNEHLVYEERYLQDIAYPQTQEHQEQHKIFSDKYNNLKNRLQNDDINKSKVVFEIETFMGSWLTTHILIEDQKYATFAKERLNK